jgi:hypothetical protein
VTDSSAPHRGESTAASGAHESAPDSPPGPLDPLVANLAEIQEYLANYLSAQKDGLKAAGRRALIVAAGAVGAGVLVLAFIAGAMVLLLVGLAHAVAVAAGGRMWVGEVSVGGGAILIVAVAGFFAARYWLRIASAATKLKYERRHNMQRARFGRDNAERAVS